MMLTMSLNEIRSYSPCKEGWQAILKGLGKSKPDDDRFSLLTAYRMTGMDNVLWAIKTLPALAIDARIYAVLCAEHIPMNVREEMFVALCEGRLTVADIEQYEAPPPDYLPKDE